MSDARYGISFNFKPILKTTYVNELQDDLFGNLEISVYDPLGNLVYYLPEKHIRFQLQGKIIADNNVPVDYLQYNLYTDSEWFTVSPFDPVKVVLKFTMNKNYFVGIGTKTMRVIPDPTSRSRDIAVKIVRSSINFSIYPTLFEPIAVYFTFKRKINGANSAFIAAATPIPSFGTSWSYNVSVPEKYMIPKDGKCLVDINIRTYDDSIKLVRRTLVAYAGRDYKLAYAMKCVSKNQSGSMMPGNNIISCSGNNATPTLISGSADSVAGIRVSKPIFTDGICSTKIDIDEKPPTKDYGWLYEWDLSSIGGIKTGKQITLHYENPYFYPYRITTTVAATSPQIFDITPELVRNPGIRFPKTLAPKIVYYDTLVSVKLMITDAMKTLLSTLGCPNFEVIYEEGDSTNIKWIRVKEIDGNPNIPVGSTVGSVVVTTNPLKSMLIETTFGDDQYSQLLMSLVYGLVNNGQSTFGQGLGANVYASPAIPIKGSDLHITTAMTILHEYLHTLGCLETDRCKWYVFDFANWFAQFNTTPGAEQIIRNCIDLWNNVTFYSSRIPVYNNEIQQWQEAIPSYEGILNFVNAVSSLEYFPPTSCRSYEFDTETNYFNIPVTLILLYVLHKYLEPEMIGGWAT